MSISSVPDYTCCITKEIMKEAVQAPCGHCFEKSAILDWLVLKSNCPLDRSLLKKEDLIINEEFRKKITGFLKEHPELKNTTLLDSIVARIKKFAEKWLKQKNRSALPHNGALPYPIPIVPVYQGAMGFGAFVSPQ